MKTLFSLLLFAYFLFPIHAQKSVQSRLDWKLKFHSNFKSNVAHDFFDTYRNDMGLTENDKMQLIHSNLGVDGLEHRKYEQYYKGIKVFGSAYTLHGDKESIHHSSGYFIPEINLEVDTHLDESLLIEKMKSVFLYRNQLSKKQVGNVSYIEKIIFDKAYPQYSNQIVLAYQVDIFDKNRTIGTRFIVDALSENILMELELIHKHSVPAKGQSTVYGEVDIIVDSIAADYYVMVDSTRGKSIETFYNNMNNKVTDEDNYWELPEGKDYNVAVDVHYCSSRFYDMMLEKYDWDGLDDNGLSYKSVVFDNSSGNFVNAYWNGLNTAFGNGDCHRAPLTTFEVVGHEFMHGITDYTSDLIYKGESGAINESMSDVFGKMLEYTYHVEEFDWEIGESFVVDSYTQSFRSMSDPNSRNMPDTYKGAFWNDNAGVHTNSAVGNHFFYRLAEGGNGLTEKDEPFNFEGIGMELATKLIFNVQSNYLVSNSNYPDYYSYSLASAENLFGQGSKEYNAVVEAWKVVGLPFEGGVKDKKDLTISIPSNIVSTCINEEFYSIPLVITNMGEETYPVGTEFEIKLTMSGKKEEYSFVLDEPLDQYKSLELSIDDFLFMTEAKNYYISVNLIIEDYDQNNNNTFFYCKNKVILDNNILLQNPVIQFKHCEGNNMVTSVRVQNVSCNEFVPTSQIQVHFINAKTKSIFYQGYLPKSSLDPEETTGLIEEVDYTGVDSFYVEMISDDDVTPDNNKSAIIVPPIDKIIEGVYYSDFSGIDPFKHLHLSSLNNIGHLNENGKDYLWTTALYTNSSGSICQDAADNIGNGRHGTNSDFSTCLNLMKNDSPFLKFSLTQYRSLDLDQFPIDVQSNSAICRVEYRVNDKVVFEKTIVNQEIGKEVTYVEELPGKTQGVLSFKFYNHLGSFSDFSPDFDNQLLSELEIGQYTSTNENAMSQTFAYPNPTTGILKLNSSNFDKVFEYQLYDLRGMQIPLILDNNEFDLSHLIAGVYFLKAYQSDKLLGVQKVILVK